MGVEDADQSEVYINRSRVRLLQCRCIVVVDAVPILVLGPGLKLISLILNNAKFVKVL